MVQIQTFYLYTLESHKLKDNQKKNYNPTLNNLKSNTLQIGQILKIPGTETYANYTVKKGDSLWKIANKYGVTVNELKQVNNLSGTTLQIGDVLLIPTK